VWQDSREALSLDRPQLEQKTLERQEALGGLWNHITETHIKPNDFNKNGKAN
jgi:hypothetical protein